MTATKTRRFRVAGVSFHPEYPQILHQLAATLSHADEPIACELSREPDNPHDGNAIAVVIPALEHPVIGHVPRDMAARLARTLDLGAVKIACDVIGVAVDPDRPDRPGLECSLRVVP